MYYRKPQRHQQCGGRNDPSGFIFGASFTIVVFSPNSIATDSEASGPGRAPGDGTAEKVFPAINPRE